ncbi:hypothetical protein BpHYR1_022645, partial [Brachionus plicatilis]
EDKPNLICREINKKFNLFLKMPVFKFKVANSHQANVCLHNYYRFVFIYIQSLLKSTENH